MSRNSAAVRATTASAVASTRRRDKVNAKSASPESATTASTSSNRRSSRVRSAAENPKRHPSGGISSAAAVRAGACSSTTWTFVPPNPNALTPARLGSASHAAQLSPTFGTRHRTAASVNSPRKTPAHGWGNTSPPATAKVALIRDAIPADDKPCPIFAFTEDRGTALPRCGPKNAFKASSSIPSPTAVAVACASTNPTFAGATPASAHASRKASDCPSARGVSGPPPRPSLFIPTPFTTANTRSPAACASSRRFNTTTPAPSPKINPFAPS